MEIMPSHPALGLRAWLADVKDDNTAGGAPLARGPRSRLSQHRSLLQNAVYSNKGETGYAESMRVRRWSTSSDVLATETMHNLTSAPRMLVGGRTVFLNPNTDVKRIPQKLPSSERAGGANWGRLRTATRNSFKELLPARKPSLPESSSGRITPEADDSDMLQQVSRSKSLELSVAVILAETRISSLSSSSSLRSRVSSASSNDTELTSDGAGWARPRGGSFSVLDASRQKRMLPRQKSVRTSTPSSRFGDPADWKGGASWKQLIQRAQSQTGQTSSGSHKAAEPSDAGVQGLRRRASENDGGAFQPVRLTW